MAAKSVVDVACEPLDAKIAELMNEIDGLVKAKQLIVKAHEAVTEQPKTRRTRGPNKQKRGLPNANAQPTTGE